jgi:hypothetical protein
MALPENRNPNVPPTHVNDLGDERIVERQSRGGWRWRWIWPVIVGLAVWWAGWGWGSTGGWWFGRTQASQNTAIPAPPGSRTTETLANAGAQQPLTNAGADARGARPQEQMVGPGVQILDAANKKNYVGRQFEASYVPVQEEPSNRTAWIGANHTMLAVLPPNASENGNANNGSITPGELVDAKGTVKKAPSASQARREWALSGQDASRLEKEGAYVQLSKLTIPKQ